MAKNNAARLLNDAVANFSKRRIDIIVEIDQLNADEKKEKNRPTDILEKVNASHQRVDESGRTYKNIVVSPYDAQDLIPPARHDNVMTHFDMVDAYCCFHFADQVKAARAAWIREQATGDEITSHERANRLHEIAEKRTELWREYESMSRELESAGLDVYRDPRTPPEILLDIDGDHYNVAILENLRRKDKSYRGLIDDINDRRQVIAAKEAANERERQQLLRAPKVSTPDVEHVDKQDSLLQAEKKKINEDYSQISKESADNRRLVHNGETRLRERGLIGDKFAASF